MCRWKGSLLLSALQLITYISNIALLYFLLLCSMNSIRNSFLLLWQGVLKIQKQMLLLIIRYHLQHISTDPLHLGWINSTQWCVISAWKVQLWSQHFVFLIGREYFGKCPIVYIPPHLSKKPKTSWLYTFLGNTNMKNKTQNRSKFTCHDSLFRKNIWAIIGIILQHISNFLD